MRLMFFRLAESLRRVEAAYMLTEEQLVREHAAYIGIMGMPRGHLDIMLHLRDKQRRHELLFSQATGTAQALPAGQPDAQKKSQCHLAPTLMFIEFP